MPRAGLTKSKYCKRDTHRSSRKLRCIRARRTNLSSGVTDFHLLRLRRNECQAFLYAFDLLELNGTDLRREPIEVRKATVASILQKATHGVRFNECTAARC